MNKEKVLKPQNEGGGSRLRPFVVTKKVMVNVIESLFSQTKKRSSFKSYEELWKCLNEECIHAPAPGGHSKSMIGFKEAVRIGMLVEAGKHYAQRSVLKKNELIEAVRQNLLKLGIDNIKSMFVKGYKFEEQRAFEWRNLIQPITYQPVPEIKQEVLSVPSQVLSKKDAKADAKGQTRLSQKIQENLNVRQMPKQLSTSLTIVETINRFCQTPPGPSKSKLDSLKKRTERTFEIARGLPPIKIPPFGETIERIANEAEEYRSEDEKQKETISAKNALESYCFNMKAAMEDDKLSETEKKVILDKCNDTIKWLDANQLGKKEEYEHRQKELEALCNPIITKLYQEAGAGSGINRNNVEYHDTIEEEEESEQIEEQCHEKIVDTKEEAGNDEEVSNSEAGSSPSTSAAERQYPRLSDAFVNDSISNLDMAFICESSQPKTLRNLDLKGRTYDQIATASKLLEMCLLELLIDKGKTTKAELNKLCRKYSSKTLHHEDYENLFIRLSGMIETPKAQKNNTVTITLRSKVEALRRMNELIEELENNVEVFIMF